MRSTPEGRQHPVTLIGLVAAIGFVTTGATVLGFLWRFHWQLDLFAHFRL